MTNRTLFLMCLLSISHFWTFVTSKLGGMAKTCKAKVKYLTCKAKAKNLTSEEKAKNFLLMR